MSQNKKITDLLPLKKYVYFEYGIKEVDLPHEEEMIHFYKVSDVENFLAKITKPENLNKLVKSMMFGSKLDLEEILK